MFSANVKFKCRDADKLINYYFEIEEWFSCGNDFKKIRNIEFTLGGDHGKGCYALMLSVIVRFSDCDIKPDIIDLECGRIEYHQDKLELLKMLIEKLKPSLHRITSGSGSERFIITSKNVSSKNFSFYNNTNNINYFNNMTT